MQQMFVECRITEHLLVPFLGASRSSMNVYVIRPCSGGLQGAEGPVMMCRAPFDKQLVNSQSRLVNWPLLVLLSALVTKPSQ